MVVFTAWRQWASARLLGSLVQRLSVDQQREDPTNGDSMAPKTPTSVTTTSEAPLKTPTSLKRRYKWTKTHSFFACTGGFAFDIQSGNDNWTGRISVPFLPAEASSRLTLTAQGVALLAKCDHLPDIPEEDILDKGKANSIAKALVVIQALWMLIQVIGKLATHLPVTILEVNTTAHVACVFLMYVMWWNKPLLPNEPIVLRGDWVDPLCAYVYMSSEMSGELEKKESQTISKTMFAYFNWYSKRPEIDNVSLRIRAPRSIDTSSEDDSQPSQNSNVSFPSFQPSSRSKSCLSELQAKRLEKSADIAFFQRRPKVKGADISEAAKAGVTQRRWELAMIAIDTYPVIQDNYTLFTHDENQCVHFRPEELIVRRVQNWPSNDLLRNVNGLTVGAILWAANFGYGAIHAAAYNEHFPTGAEKWLWRSSAFYIGFCGGLWIILNYVAQSYQPMNEFWEGWMDGKRRWYWNVLIGSAVLICGMAFILARAFIVVEAFISIRDRPAAAYDTPNWSQVFPHL